MRQQILILFICILSNLGVAQSTISLDGQVFFLDGVRYGTDMGYQRMIDSLKNLPNPNIEKIIIQGGNRFDKVPFSPVFFPNVKRIDWHSVPYAGIAGIEDFKNLVGLGIYQNEKTYWQFSLSWLWRLKNLKYLEFDASSVYIGDSTLSRLVNLETLKLKVADFAMNELVLLPHLKHFELERYRFETLPVFVELYPSEDFYLYFRYAYLSYIKSPAKDLIFSRIIEYCPIRLYKKKQQYYEILSILEDSKYCKSFIKKRQLKNLRKNLNGTYCIHDAALADSNMFICGFERYQSPQREKIEFSYANGKRCGVWVDSLYTIDGSDDIEGLNYLVIKKNYDTGDLFAFYKEGSEDMHRGILYRDITMADTIQIRLEARNEGYKYANKKTFKPVSACMRVNDKHNRVAFEYNYNCIEQYAEVCIEDYVNCMVEKFNSKENSEKIQEFVCCNQNVLSILFNVINQEL